MRFVVWLLLGLVSSPFVRSLENVDVADVVIAVDVGKYQRSDAQAISAFFDDIASNVLIGHEKTRVSVAQFSKRSNDVEVSISLRGGTDSKVIANAKVADIPSTLPDDLQPNEIVRNIKNLALQEPKGHRPNVPNLVVVLIRHDPADISENFSEWSESARQLAEIYEAAPADVVQVVNKFSGSSSFFLRSSSFLTTPGDATERTTAEEIFKFAAEDATKRIQGALKSCPYEKEVSKNCYYNNQTCVADVLIKPQSTRKSRPNYCLHNTTTDCEGGVTKCMERCREVSSTECLAKQCGVQGSSIRRPKDAANPEIVALFEQCLKSENYNDEPCITPCSGEQNESGSKATNVEGTAKRWKCDEGDGIEKAMRLCAPMWLIMLVVLLFASVSIVMAWCLTRLVYKRRLDAEKRKTLESLSRIKEQQEQQQIPSRGVAYFELSSGGSVQSGDGKSRHGPKASIRSQSVSFKSKELPPMQKSSIGEKTAIDFKSKMSALSMSKTKSPKKHPGASKKSSESKKSAGSGSRGSFDVEKPPSLTTRSVDELFGDKKGSKSMAPSTRTAIDHKTRARSVTKTARSPKATTKRAKRSEAMKSRGYRS